MSGGHWNCAGYRIKYELERIAGDPAVGERWPQTSRALRRLAKAIHWIERTMDWDLSGDASVEGDDDFDARAVQVLYDAVAGEMPSGNDAGSPSG